MFEALNRPFVMFGVIYKSHENWVKCNGKCIIFEKETILKHL